MSLTTIRKSLPDDLRRIAKTMRSAEIRQFTARDGDVLREAAALLERSQGEASKPEGGAS